MVTVSSKKCSKCKIAKIKIMIGLFFQTHSASLCVSLCFYFRWLFGSPNTAYLVYSSGSYLTQIQPSLSLGKQIKSGKP